ncbi:hypothetical protein BV25DRAFT_1180510 [Artomyces pyxidatus]|uniref:Uncharacterized protein n=1 Tax=Artomyces pyxidatus TaxID=48021 RepID=A0ACB8SRV0_9AGAM|nr:hypothetical protein BV25DRAFT_1180510 [Artomyces pyxidatus]
MSGPSSTSSASGSMTILFFKLDLDLRKAASQAKSRPTRRDRVDRYLSAGNRRFTNTVAVAHVLRHRQVRQAARFWGSSVSWDAVNAIGISDHRYALACSRLQCSVRSGLAALWQATLAVHIMFSTNDSS